MRAAEIITEKIKQRLDPKCWKGKHKEGTKIKGGVRVNNCVPNESVDESVLAEAKSSPLYHFTSFNKLVRILVSNMLQAPRNTIYFTRDYLRQILPHEQELLKQPYGLRINQEQLARDYGRKLKAGGQPLDWDEKKRQAWLADPENADEIARVKSTGRGTGRVYDGALPEDIINGTVTQARRWESEEHLNVSQLPNLDRYLTGIVIGKVFGKAPESREIDPDPLTEVADLLITLFSGDPKGFEKRNWLLDSVMKLGVPIVYNKRDFDPAQVKNKIIQLYSQRKREREEEAGKPQEFFIIFTSKNGGGFTSSGSNIQAALAKSAQNPSLRNREIYGYSRGDGKGENTVMFDDPVKLIDYVKRLKQLGAKDTEVALTKNSSQGVAEGNLREIGYAAALDGSNYPTDDLLKSGKVVGQIEGNDVMITSSGEEKVYFLVFEGKVASFLGFKNGSLKNIKNFTNTPGVVRALLGYLIHKKNKRIKITADEELTPDGIKWLIHLIESPRGLKITDSFGKPLDPKSLKKEWEAARNSGVPGPTGVVISENHAFGTKLRANEEQRQNPSLLMHFNLYETPTKQDMEKDHQELTEFVDDPKFDRGDDSPYEDMPLSDIAKSIMMHIGDEFTVSKGSVKGQPSFLFTPKDQTKFGAARIWTTLNRRGTENPTYSTILFKYEVDPNGQSRELGRHAEKIVPKSNRSAVKTAELIYSNTGRKPTASVSKESLDESYVDRNLSKVLARKGYKFLAKGKDQEAYLAPDDTILKIFGADYSTGGNMYQLSKSQMAFKAFADFCKENPNNPFLPNFTDWATFEFNNSLYLQIKMERLFPFTGEEKQWTIILADLGMIAEGTNSLQDKKEFIDETMEKYYSGPAFFTHLGKDGFDLLWSTINQLGKIAKRQGVILDLHGGNFMLGSDGHIVISDPFYEPED